MNKQNDRKFIIKRKNIWTKNVFRNDKNKKETHFCQNEYGIKSSKYMHKNGKKHIFAATVNNFIFSMNF